MGYVKKYGLIVLLIVIPTIAIFITSVWKDNDPKDEVATPSAEPKKSYQRLGWNTMRGLDHQTGQMSAELAKLNNQSVMIPGFIVPLDDDAATYSEFLLVPDVQACIHVPPPPPNQMVLVKMASGDAPKRSQRPIWIRGTLQIVSTNSSFGTVAYKMYGDDAEEWTEESMKGM